MRLPFDNLGRLGFIGDILGHELPPEAWTGGQNARMRDGIARKISGNQAIYGTPSATPHWLLPVPTTTDYRWLYASLTKVFTVDSGRVHTDITRAVGGDYIATLNNNWNGGLLNGIPVINNGFDLPQAWNPPAPATPLVNLPNWPATWLARCVRPYRSFLFAMDVQESGTRFQHKVRWSHPALPGAVPASWDDTDPTKDAGQATLSDTGGFVLDSLSLRNTNIVYKEDQVWGFQFVGGAKVFEPQRILSEIGALSRDCAVPFFAQGLKHAVFGADDLYIHDGNSAQSIADRRVRRWLFSQIDGTNYPRCFAVANYDAKEVWFCFVPTGETLAKLALPWSWVDGTFSPPRELPGVRSMAAGLTNDTGISDSWDSDAAAWDTDTTLWDDKLFGSAVRRLLMGDIAGPTLQQLDVGNRFDGVNMTASLERTGLAFAKQSRDGSLKADLQVRKLVKELWPKIEASPGTVLNIYVGTQEELNDPVTWIGPFAFTVGTHKKVNPLVSGRFIGVRFESTTDVNWRLHGYELEIEPLGIY